MTMALSLSPDNPPPRRGGRGCPPEWAAGGASFPREISRDATKERAPARAGKLRGELAAPRAA